VNATVSTTTEDNDGPTRPLVKAIKDEHVDEDRRCRHSDCDGELTLTDAENPICKMCRCTPDGIYLPPQSRGGGSGFSTPYPKGSRPETAGAETYENSDIVRLPGGHEAVYDETEANRPHGVGPEYTFDLSTY
jgi:hypothetical protein